MPLDDLETFGYYCLTCKKPFYWNGESWGKEMCETKNHEIVRLISEFDLAIEYVHKSEIEKRINKINHILETHTTHYGAELGTCIFCREKIAKREELKEIIKKLEELRGEE